MGSFFLENITMFPASAIGIVAKAIAPDRPGRVRFRASVWPARFYHSGCQVTVFPNDTVTIVGMAGIALLVRPGTAAP